MAHQTRHVEITYPHGKPCLAEIRPASYGDGEMWVRGHGEVRQLIEQQGCTITPLIAMTPERIAALRLVFAMAGNDESSYHMTELEQEVQGALATIEAMLTELEATA